MQHVGRRSGRQPAPAIGPGAQVTTPDAARALRGRVLHFAWPVIGQNLLETLLGIVSTVLVAGLGTAALAGAGSALQIMLFVLAALSALAAGSSILIAQAVGAADTARASRLARQSLLWSALFSLPLAGAGVALAGPIIGIFGLSPEVARIGARYLQVMMGSVVVMVASLIAGGVLRGAGDSRTPLVVSAIANVLNVVLAYGLIYGRWGLPPLGAVGSAWATLIARTLTLALLLRPLWTGTGGVSVARGGRWRLEWSIARQILRLGVPAALEQVLLSSAFLAVTILVARLGAPTLAAQRISMSALSFSFLPGIGFGVAATALIAQSIGARRSSDVAGIARVATTSAVIWMSGIALLLLGCATPIMHLFTSEPEVIRIGVAGLRVVALTQPFWGVIMVQSGALRGTGNTRFSLIVGSIGMWSAVLLAALALQLAGGGLPMIWAAFLLTAPVTALATSMRFRRSVRELEAGASTIVFTPQHRREELPGMEREAAVLTKREPSTND